MLEAIVFVCGAALMGLELLASRVLAPALGNSLFVWGSVISVVMVALSLGYWLGGHLADRFGSTRTLGPVIAGAGLFTVAVPPIAAVVLPLVSGLGPRVGSLAAASLIFFAPALLLAMVSPLGVRLAAREGVERIGRSAGGLYAISTIGSVAGTLATAFWLIPLMSLEPLVVNIGFVLFATAAVALLLPARYAEHDAEIATAPGLRFRTGTLGTVALGFALGAWALSAAASPTAGVHVDFGERVLLKKDTQYHRLLVTEDATQRSLRFDRSKQSGMALADPYASTVKYPDYMHLALALKPDAKRVLVVGLGGGAIVKRVWRDYPGVTVDAVEIDPVVVDVAKRYFALPEDPRVRVSVEDGRRFLQASRDTYDIIIMDAYYADALPFHLTTQEFLREAKARLAPDGVLAYNVIASVEGDRSQLFRSMYRTAGGVWGRLWVFPIGLGENHALDENRNIIVLATDNPTTRGELLDRISRRVDGRVTIPGFAGFGRDLYTGVVQQADVPTLTDSHAPTDSLIKVN